VQNNPAYYGPPPPANAIVTVTIIPPPVVTINNQTPETSIGNTTSSVLVDPNQQTNNVVLTYHPPDYNPAQPDQTNYTCSVTKSDVNETTVISNNSSDTITNKVTTKTTYTVDCANQYGRHSIKTILVNVLLNYQEF